MQAQAPPDGASVTPTASEAVDGPAAETRPRQEAGGIKIPVINWRLVQKCPVDFPDGVMRVGGVQAPA